MRRVEKLIMLYIVLKTHPENSGEQTYKHFRRNSVIIFCQVAFIIADSYKNNVSPELVRIACCLIN